MRKIDIKALLDQNKVEYELRVVELLKFKNEREAINEKIKSLEDWINVLRGRFDAYNKIWEELVDDSSTRPNVEVAVPKVKKNKNENLEEGK